MEKKEVSYLTKEEMDSLLNACDNQSRKGRRDYLPGVASSLQFWNEGFRNDFNTGRDVFSLIMANVIYG